MSALALPFLIAMLMWLACKITTYALPCLIGFFAACWALEAGAGWLGAIAVFGVTAVVSFELMRALFVSVASPTFRLILAIAFVAPAALMGCLILDHLSTESVPSEAWRQALCALGAGLAGMLALSRLVAQDQD